MDCGFHHCTRGLHCWWFSFVPGHNSELIHCVCLQTGDSLPQTCRFSRPLPGIIASELAVLYDIYDDFGGSCICWTPICHRHTWVGDRHDSWCNNICTIQWIMIKQEILYIVTNLMYSPGTLSSWQYLKICLIFLSLYKCKNSLKISVRTTRWCQISGNSSKKVLTSCYSVWGWRSVSMT